MNIVELLDAAKRQQGSQKAVAELMGKKTSRLSEWRSGAQKPDAGEIAYLAELAGLPVVETVLEIEAQLDQRYARIWTDALGKLKAAGIAAGLIVTISANAIDGGRYWDRTSDPCRVKAMLSR